MCVYIYIYIYIAWDFEGSRHVFVPSLEFGGATELRGEIIKIITLIMIITIVLIKVVALLRATSPRVHHHY